MCTNDRGIEIFYALVKEWRFVVKLNAIMAKIALGDKSYCVSVRR
jgi:hypothetical protein